MFSFAGGTKSKSYNPRDIKMLIQYTDLKIKKSKVLDGVVLWAELVHDDYRQR